MTTTAIWLDNIALIVFVGAIIAGGVLVYLGLKPRRRLRGSHVGQFQHDLRDWQRRHYP